MNTLSIDSVNLRQSEDGQYSVIDALTFISQKSNARMVWKRISEQHPNIVEKVTLLKPTTGKRRPTPMADRATIVEIIALIPPERSRFLDDEGEVYLISAKDMPVVKIGKSRTPIARLAAHQISSPVPLSLVKSVKTQMMTDTERALKEFFADYHSHGEWYRIGIDKASLLFDEAVAACKPFQDFMQAATLEQLEKATQLMDIQLKAFRKTDARGHSEISAVVQSAADKFQLMLEEFGVV